MRTLLPRQLLAVPLLAVPLAGCGSAAHHDAGADPDPSPAVAVVHRTVGGGHVATEATTVGSPERLAAYLRPFSPGLRRAVRQAARSVPNADGTLVAQVVAVGCDPVERARVVVTDGTVRIEPVAPTTTHPECLAPVTSVALGVVQPQQ
jgi:hypothetical protein